MAETPNNTFESYNHGGRNVNGYVNGEKVTIVQGNFYAAGFPTSSTAPSSGYDLSSIQRTLREIYSQSFCEIAPFSLPFFFDIEEKWVNLTLKLEGDSTVTDDYADLFKQTFANIKMLIVEGDPGIGIKERILSWMFPDFLTSSTMQATSFM
uniref:Uncharacterized protein n=1 Tax=Plectus sambesii TaxID=2011161 RepID=A0A914WXT9_9BILA